jgi:hypothetical protein
VCRGVTAQPQLQEGLWLRVVLLPLGLYATGQHNKLMRTLPQTLDSISLQLS